MNKHYDVAVIGAGPAGMAAAKQCDLAGVSTLLLDEQVSLGGQIYRSIEHKTIADENILGKDYYKGRGLAQSLRKTNVDYQPCSKVWKVTGDKEIGFSRNNRAEIVTAQQIIVATGAQERPFPIPGWTLPGVMNAGAAQILLKTTGVTTDHAVFIGSGPLLYLIVRQYLMAGTPVAAVLDTTPLSNYVRTMPALWGAVKGYKNIIKGQRWISEIKKAGIPFIRGVKDVRVNGSDGVESVEYTTGSTWKKIVTKNVFLHQGVIPNSNLTRSIGCKHHWSETQLCWQVSTDEWGQTDIAGVAVAGDGAGIGGAVSAEHQGIIAAAGALYRLGAVGEYERNTMSSASRAIVKNEASFRQFLDVLFQPAEHFRIPKDNEVLVCRCEEVTAGDIREMVTQGCASPNQCKSYSRCGMGACQGRFCGITVSEMISKATNKPIEEVGYYRIREPIKPLSLGEMACLSKNHR